MMEWIDLLTMMGIVMAGLSIVTAFAVLVNFARQALKQRKPKLIKVVSEKKKEEKPIVLKETVASTVNHCGTHKRFIKGCKNCLRAVGIKI